MGIDMLIFFLFFWGRDETIIPDEEKKMHFDITPVADH